MQVLLEIKEKKSKNKIGESGGKDEEKREEDRRKRQTKCRKQRKREIRAKKQERKNKMVLLLPQLPKDTNIPEGQTFQSHIPGKTTLFPGAVCTWCYQLLPELRAGQKLK